eukprot:TRINITY_DN11234_c0_g1_i1.p1 TRINITY_DN11234_c0_g1~~TRINITY_DN11234_c0_g1_i1.p1  ORF type:complete len:335 (+),score=41.34 TRINITY_DN11234_c0_g1_i1:121-1125(+)
MENSTWLLSAMHTLDGSTGELALDFQAGFGLPASANMYATLPGFQTAAARHTDRMDAFIVQTSGKKHWKVWIPKVSFPVWGVHENGQWGKGFDRVESNQTGPLVLEHTLRPGELLYVPRGFLHETSTSGPGALPEPSVALTVALATEVYDLVYEKSLQCLLWAAGICTDHPCRAATLVSAQARRDWSFRRALPLGFLKRDLKGNGTHRAAWIQTLSSELVHMLEESGVDLAGGHSEAADRVGAQLAAILWDTLESTMASDGYKSFFAPLNAEPGACLDPRCQQRAAIPHDRKQAAIGRVLGYELRRIGHFCNKQKVQKPYIDMQQPTGGLIQTL